MRVTLITVGTLGDIQPFVALGKALRAVGHDVRLATHAYYEPLVRRHGLGFAPIAANPRELLEGGPAQDWVNSGSNPLRFVGGLMQVAGPMVHELFGDCLRACADADAIVTSFLGFLAGYHVAQKLGVRLVSAYLQPVHRTRAFPAFFLPELPAWLRIGRGPYNRLTHVLVEQIFWRILRQPMNQARREVLSLPPLGFCGPPRLLVGRPIPTLYGYSPRVLPKPADWGEEVHVTGYWFLNGRDQWQPPPALADFLDSGPAPVYVGFGSMSNRDPEETTALVLDALREAGRRAILMTGWGGLTEADLPEGVFRVDAVPHEWLFPRMAAVVHHGGSGTTGMGLRAGVPNVVVPFFADQSFWGWRVRDLGAGPAPIPRAQLSAGRLARAIRVATSDEAMRRRAMELGGAIRAEDGLASAVQAFQHHLAPGSDAGSPCAPAEKGGSLG